MTSSEFSAQIAAYLDGAVCCDCSDRTQIEAAGPDAAKFLHNFTTQEVNGLEPGAGGETFFCNVRGKTIGHGFLLRLPDSIVIDTVPGQAESLYSHLDRYLIAEDVELQHRSEWGLVAVLGTHAKPLVESAIGRTPDGAVSSALHGGLEIRRTRAFDNETLLVRCPVDSVSKVLDRLTGAGAVPVERPLLETIRIAAAVPQFGADITEDNLPQEIHRDALAISFDKGCYLGQETVARIDALGHVNWQLASVHGPAGLTSGDELAADGKRAGAIRSCVDNPAGDGVIGFALLRRELAKAGSVLPHGAGDIVVVEPPMPLTAPSQ